MVFIFSCKTIYWLVLSGVQQRLYYGAHYTIIYSYKVWRWNMILIIYSNFQSLFNVMSPLHVAFFEPKKRLFLQILDIQDTLLLTLLFNRKKKKNVATAVQLSTIQWLWWCIKYIVSKFHRCHLPSSCSL